MKRGKSDGARHHADTHAGKKWLDLRKTREAFLTGFGDGKGDEFANRLHAARRDVSWRRAGAGVVVAL